MRYLPGDTCLNTQLMRFDHPGDDNPTEIYGRKIPLEMFVDKTLWKYKTIEQWGQDVRERIFITEGRLDFESRWWESDIYAYPIQSKIFGFGDPTAYGTFSDIWGSTTCSIPWPCDMSRKDGRNPTTILSFRGTIIK